MPLKTPSKLSFGGALILAPLVIIVWSTTFASTKTLLELLSPEMIMFYRFVLAYISLFIFYPRLHRVESWRIEFLYFLASLTGCTLYFMAENTALLYASTINVGLLVATAPVLTLLLSILFAPTERITPRLIVGTLLAFVGVFLVLTQGSISLDSNLLGDTLSLLAALMWALYSLIIRRISTAHTLLYTTQKIFLYALLTMIPILIYRSDSFHLATLITTPRYGLNIVFLGIIASSLAFYLWNLIVHQIGAVRANNFINLSPLVVVLTSILFLQEPITIYLLIGGCFIIAGLYVSSK